MSVRGKSTVEMCHHGRQKYYCKECKGKGICVHNTRKSYCRECGGSQICIHDKVKTGCKVCREAKQKNLREKTQSFREKSTPFKGIIFVEVKYDKAVTDKSIVQTSYKCIHDRQKAHCRDYCGSVFCIHGKRKIYCKECGGNGICLHNKIKYTCRQCREQKNRPVSLTYESTKESIFHQEAPVPLDYI